MAELSTIPFEHSYAQLGETFASPQRPTPVSAPKLLAFNWNLATQLNLSLPDDAATLANYFSGNKLFATANPIAQAYAGHQFGHFNPRLGDGRAILLGEVIDAGGTRRDIQLKGAGPTPYSRSGDGRAALGPVLREFLISEAMYHLGVPTTRALAAVSTGESLWRQGPQPGAVLTRVASSHIRVGTFEYFYRHGLTGELKSLADYVITRHYPEATNTQHPYLHLLDRVIARQAELIAHWMHIGFIHGVMNTDNTSISAETIDYGPCAFMDNFVPHQCFSSIDREGRYAYSQQPKIALWNLSRFAECLLFLLDENTQTAVTLAETSLARFNTLYQNAWLSGWRKKLALAQQTDEEDTRFITEYLQCLKIYKLDFTYTNRNLACALEGKLPGVHPNDSPQLQHWLEQWRVRLEYQNTSKDQLIKQLHAANPNYIPRNYWVEKAIQQAQESNDLSLFHELYELFKNPYHEQAGKSTFGTPPPGSPEPYQTFCGT